MATMTIPEAQEKWRVSAQRIRQWIYAGRIKGAVKAGRDWSIPARAKRPAKLTNGAKV